MARIKSQIPAAAPADAEKGLGSGRGVPDLEKALRRLVAASQWDMRESLPTTRELGRLFQVSNASVCRLLQRLDDEDVVWRRDNGRYYLNEARRLYERRRPYACLIRKLQMWSGIYRSIMTGFSATFADDRMGMLFVHNDALVRHTDTAHPPIHAKAAAQQEALAEFFRHHHGQFEGILLDDVWQDDILEKMAADLRNAVVVCRPSRLVGVSSVAPDFDASALLAIGHLYARGYEELWLAIPFTTAVPVDLMAVAARQAAVLLGRPIPPANVLSVATPDDREKFITRARAAKKRVGVFCPEDNIALLLWRGLQEAGIDCPGRIGLLSGMGTSIVAGEGISSLQIDYERIGAVAAGLLIAHEHRVVKLPTQLVFGKTT